MPSPLELLTGSILQTKLSPQGLPPLLQGQPMAPKGQQASQAPQQPKGALPNVLDRQPPQQIFQGQDPAAPVTPAAQPQQPQAPGGVSPVNPQTVAQASAIMAALVGGNPYQTIGSSLGLPFNLPFLSGNTSPAFTPTLNQPTSQILSSILGALQPNLAGNPAVAALFQPNSFQFQPQGIPGHPGESQFQPVPYASLIGPALQALTQIIAGVA